MAVYPEFAGGKYKIVRELGHGGMGVVYLAIDTSLDREVALKMLRPGLTSDPKAMRAFQKEARAIAALSHPNIVHINSLDQVEGQFLIDMPYLAGGSFRAALTHGVSPAWLAQILRSVLGALKCCHEASVIHCDVKPSNLLFDTYGVVKLSDFGISRLTDGAWETVLRERDSTVMFAGTPQYMCPEAFESQTPTPQFDIYALGMVAREAVVGPIPITSGNPYQFILTLVQNPMPPIAGTVDHVSHTMAELIDAMTMRDATKRLPTAAACLDILATCPEMTQEPEFSLETIPLDREAASAASAPSFRNWPSTVQQPNKGRLIRQIFAGVAIVAGLAAAGTAGWSMRNEVNSSDSMTVKKAIPSQQVLQHTIPTAEAILASTRDAMSNHREIRRGHSQMDPAAKWHILVEHDPVVSSYHLIAYSDFAAWVGDLRPSASGTMTLTGHWGAYVAGSNGGFRWGNIRGTADEAPNFENPVLLSLTLDGSTTPTPLIDALLLTPADSTVTDTAFLAALEAAPGIASIIYQELSARNPEAVTAFDHFVPALAGGRVDALGLGDATIHVDGVPDEDAWPASSIDAWPAGQGTLHARSSEEGLYLALDAEVPESRGWRCRFAVLALSSVPIVNSPYAVVEITPDRAVVQRVARGRSIVLEEPLDQAWHEEAGRLTLELRLPWTQIGDGTAAFVPHFVRVNAQITASEPASGPSIAVWGWPNLHEPWHGLLSRVSGVSGQTVAAQT
ncbi:MAG: hypothetical protein AMXMBFR84_24780 [Candidatus Hydrogenedentota bacterium]